MFRKNDRDMAFDLSQKIDKLIDEEFGEMTIGQILGVLELTKAKRIHDALRLADQIMKE